MIVKPCLTHRGLAKNIAQIHDNFSTHQEVKLFRYIVPLPTSHYILDPGNMFVKKDALVALSLQFLKYFNILPRLFQPSATIIRHLYETSQ